MPEIVITSPNARFVIHFDRTADECWILTWPSFVDRAGVERFRSLEAAMSAIAEFILRTEF